MTINNIEVNATEFAFDGCHKIYLIETEQDKKEVLATSYKILPITDLKETYKNSCGLKFISNWSLTIFFIEQGMKAKFD